MNNIPPNHPNSVDICSASNFEHFVTEHIHLDLNCDFESRKIRGSTTLKIQRLQPGNVLSLDVQKLTIDSITANGENATFEIEDFVDFGKKLSIKLPQNVDNSKQFDLVIKHEGGEGAGIQWLTPEQTGAKRHPMVYTQGQACLNRSIFPCQDTPAIKSTYSAELHVPEGLVGVMSAQLTASTPNSITIKNISMLERRY